MLWTDDRQAYNQLKILLQELAETTGLHVNPLKSEVIPIGDNLSDQQKEILADFGVIKENVKHLGVVFSINYEEGHKLTFEAGKQAMNKSIPRIAGGISSMNLRVKPSMQ